MLPNLFIVFLVTPASLQSDKIVIANKTIKHNDDMVTTIPE